MLRVRTYITGGQGGDQYNQFHFGGTTSGEAVIAAARTGQLWATLGGFLNSSYVFNVSGDVELVDATTGNILEIFPATPVTVEAEDTGDALPWATQGLIRWRTGVYEGGREVRGRTFIPGWPETASTAGDPTSAAVTAMFDAAGAFLTNSAGAGGLHVYSPTKGLSRPVSTRSVWDKWAVLRSRRS